MRLTTRASIGGWVSADYGTPGLHDTLAAIGHSQFPVIGGGLNARAAAAPYRTTLEVNAHFAPSHLAPTGVPLPAHGAQARRIDHEFAADRRCTDLSATAP